MNVALIGATGMAGAQILQELVDRGHHVTAIVRNIAKVDQHPFVNAVSVDINDVEQLAVVLEGHDVVMSAVHFIDMKINSLLTSLSKANIKRYMMVGGAGGLKLPSGERLVDSPEFPAHVRPEAIAGIKILETLQKTEELNWTVLAPSMIFKSGAKTGNFRLGKDELLIPNQGLSQISTQDYAIAFVDELEHPKYPRQRFTVGY